MLSYVPPILALIPWVQLSTLSNPIGMHTSRSGWVSVMRIYGDALRGLREFEWRLVGVSNPPTPRELQLELLLWIYWNLDYIEIPAGVLDENSK
jgi:hypothetical protein